MDRAFYSEIKKILTNARDKVYQTANFTTVSYTHLQWHKVISALRIERLEFTLAIEGENETTNFL